MGIAIGFQRELSILTYLMSGDRVSLGKAGEMYSKIALEAHGYLTDIDHQPRKGDLRTVCPSGQVLRIEVKTARLSKRDYYEFGLKIKRKDGTVRTDCHNCDAIMLLGINRSGRVEIYILPAKAAANVNVIKIPAKLSVKSHWKQYRQHLGGLSLNEVEGLNREILASRTPMRSDDAYSFSRMANNQAVAK